MSDKYRTFINEEDVDDELADIVRSVVEVQYADYLRIAKSDLEDILDYVETYTLKSGERIDLGCSLTTTAVSKIKRIARKHLKDLNA
jgi:hypothetical protein